MSSAHTYSDADVKKKLVGTLATWQLADSAITREYHTKDWAQNQLLVGAIGFICEACQHHPELIVNWNQVTVRLNTHDASGITDKDFETAERIESHVIWMPESSSPLHAGATSVNGDWVH